MLFFWVLFVVVFCGSGWGFWFIVVFDSGVCVLLVWICLRFSFLVYFGSRLGWVWFVGLFWVLGFGVVALGGFVVDGCGLGFWVAFFCFVFLVVVVLLDWVGFGLLLGMDVAGGLVCVCEL